MSTSQALRDTAAYLLAQAAIMEGKPLPAGFDMNDKSTWWPAMIAQFDAEALPHAWREWGTDTPLPELAGNNAPMPRCFDTHRPLWEAAQRGDPIREGGPNIKVDGVAGWPGPDGKPFRMQEYQKRGTEAVYDVIAWLDSESPHGIAWKGSPAVAPTYPKDPPALEPVGR